MAQTATLTESLTYAQLVAKIQASELKKGASYSITDRGITLTAFSSNQLNPDGLRNMLCPANYSESTDAYGNVWKGVWFSGISVSVNDLVIWGGLVWKSQTGSAGTSVNDYTLDEINWQVVHKDSFQNHEYVELIFNVNYDIENDWINKQWDSFGNILGVDKESYDYDIYEHPVNPIDFCDWNFITSGFPMFNNQCKYIYNNRVYGAISSNIITGSIRNNYTADISSNSNNGDISNNSNDGTIYYNSNNGNITGNSINGSINHNRNNGRISYNSSIENAPLDIEKNVNNGLIQGSWGASVTDVTVNKLS